MIKVLTVFGTRPEAIKLAPVIKEFERRHAEFMPVICVSGQHRQMLDQVLDLFDIVPDYDLAVMSKDQDLFDISARVMRELRAVLTEEKPDLIMVQGDTTTTFMASLAAYYVKTPVAHIEAGLRTYNKYQPFPEEKNRHMTAVLADYHFAPTASARSNLLVENIPERSIWVTGNTGIDALLEVAARQERNGQDGHWRRYFAEECGIRLDGAKLVLLTCHRRESFGAGLENICRAVARIAREHDEAEIVFPVHFNPHVREVVDRILHQKKLPNIHLLDPLQYGTFVWLMKNSYLILTDSGGIQEEAPSLDKPVLVMRETTERQEGVEAGCARLTGTDVNSIVREADHLLQDESLYRQMSLAENPFGDGKAAARIASVLEGAPEAGLMDEVAWA